SDPYNFTGSGFNPGRIETKVFKNGNQSMIQDLHRKINVKVAQTDSIYHHLTSEVTPLSNFLLKNIQ
ncbi:22281_t:CDS:1, partial [Cetraspora pellucida]